MSMAGVCPSHWFWFSGELTPADRLVIAVSTQKLRCHLVSDSWVTPTHAPRHGSEAVSSGKLCVAPQADPNFPLG